MDKNESISCSVTSCKNHSNEAQYCALSHIKIGTHESNPTQIECTDCQSFEMK